jgi:hypothetical protein
MPLCTYKKLKCDTCKLGRVCKYALLSVHTRKEIKFICCEIYSINNIFYECILENSNLIAIYYAEVWLSSKLEN